MKRLIYKINEKIFDPPRVTEDLFTAVELESKKLKLAEKYVVSFTYEDLNKFIEISVPNLRED